MLEHLEQIRRKPLHVRKMILVVTTSVITGIIFAVWLFYWIPSLKNISHEENSAAISASAGQAPTALLLENLKSLKNSFSSGFSEIKNQTRF